MTTDELTGMLRETVGRTRAAVSASLASIERSDDRVRDTLHLLMRSRHRLELAVTRFELAPARLSDEQLAEAADRWQAAAEQREIEQEMLWSAARVGMAED